MFVARLDIPDNGCLSFQIVPLLLSKYKIYSPERHPANNESLDGINQTQKLHLKGFSRVSEN